MLKTAARRTLELEAEGILSPERVLEARELEPVLEVVQRHRGIEDTDARAAQHVQRAADAIAPFADGPVKEALVAAARYARRARQLAALSSPPRGPAERPMIHPHSRGWLRAFVLALPLALAAAPLAASALERRREREHGQRRGALAPARRRAGARAAIIELRQQRGGFKRVEDLLEVKGIGEAASPS